MTVPDQEPPEHNGKIVIGDILSPGAPADLKLPTVKFVHYPGAQQLIVWLPRPGYQGYDMLTVSRGAEIVERETVQRQLNGSVQILFRTLVWPPGDYTISITNSDGFRHEITLTKYVSGAEPAPPPPPTPPAVAVDPPAIVYREGFGKIIPNADLEMREEVIRNVARKLARRLEYEGNYRAGTIHYVDGDRRISFWHEMCGAPMKFAIDIPKEDQWEVRTGAPLSERDEIVRFVAEQVKRDQAPDWRFEITANSIDFY